MYRSIVKTALITATVTLFAGSAVAADFPETLHALRMVPDISQRIAKRTQPISPSIMRDMLADYQRLAESGELDALIERSAIPGPRLFYAGVPSTFQELLDMYGHVNPAEYELLKRDTKKAIYAMYDGYLAREVARELWEAWTLYLGNGDAFRHCLWMYLTSEDTGTSFAKEWGDAHETEDSGPAVSKEMDLYNNWVGRMLYDWGEPVDSVIVAVVTGNLVRANMGVIEPTNSDGLKI
jgi:hypothetical protein